MNNQVKLIDANKLKDWLGVEIALSGGRDPVLQFERWAFQQVKKAIDEGKFDPDPPPAPTIKPGDRNYLTSSIVNMDGELFFNVSGVYGHFDWHGLQEFIRGHQDNNGPHEMVNIAKKHPNKEVCFEFELKHIESEYQYNNTDSPPFVLPGYYMATNVIVTEVKELEVVE